MIGCLLGFIVLILEIIWHRIKFGIVLKLDGLRILVNGSGLKLNLLGFSNNNKNMIFDLNDY